MIEPAESSKHKGFCFVDVDESHCHCFHLEYSGSLMSHVWSESPSLVIELSEYGAGQALQ